MLTAGTNTHPAGYSGASALSGTGVQPIAPLALPELCLVEAHPADTSVALVGVGTITRRLAADLLVTVALTLALAGGRAVAELLARSGMGGRDR